MTYSSKSSRDALEQALAKIADPKGEGSRAILTLYTDAARKAADASDARAKEGSSLGPLDASDARAKEGSSLGPLDGAIVTIKDLFDVQGEVTRAGSKVLATRNAPAKADAIIVQRLRKAGAVIVGKTNMTEFAYSGMGANPHFGTPGSPGDRKRVPGGSSSGAAVSAGDGFCDIAIGSDTGGSTRIPAAFCGVVGFKPTTRRVPRDGAFPLSSTLDSVGPITRSVADCALADAVMAGETHSPLPPISLSGIRAGFVQGVPVTNLDAIVSKAFAAAKAKLSPLWKAADVNVDAIDIALKVNERGGIPHPEAYTVHRQLLAEAGDGIDPNIKARLERSKNILAADYIQNLRDRAVGVALVDQLFEKFDVLVMPTTPIVPPLMTEIATPESFVTFNLLALQNTALWNFFDNCAISLPLNLGNELPVGLMLVGRHGHDRALLTIAAEIEKALKS